MTDVNFIAKRKTVFTQESRWLLDHAMNNVIRIDSPQTRNVYADDTQATLQLEQDSTGPNLVLSHRTQPELRFLEEDQTDPAGRFRIIATSDELRIQTLEAADWGSASTVFTIEGGVANGRADVTSMKITSVLSLGSGVTIDSAVSSGTHYIRALGTGAAAVNVASIVSASASGSTFFDLIRGRLADDLYGNNNDIGMNTSPIGNTYIGDTDSIRTTSGSTDYYTLNASATIVAKVSNDASDPWFAAGGSDEFKFTNAGKFGAYGATPIVQPTGVAVTAAGIHAALVSLGWITT